MAQFADTPSAVARHGRLSARPHLAAGIENVTVAGRQVALVSVPPGYRPDRPAPLLVLLHGAGGDAVQAIGWLQDRADAAGLMLLAPQAEDRTWDVILGGYGPDVERIDAALDHVFRRFAVDPERLAIGGFSDGASYAVSLGIINGALFKRVAAFSPGFAAPTAARDSPRFFVSHGIRDEVLPIGSCSRRLVPKLRSAGFDVDYREFDGGHILPPDILAEAVDWLLRAP